MRKDNPVFEIKGDYTDFGVYETRSLTKPQDIRRMILDQLRHFSSQPIKER